MSNYLIPEIQQSLKESLRNAKEGMLVTFTKADGTERKMRCTLSEESIPAREESAKTSSRAVSTESLAVYDLEKSAWRSFRYDSIIRVE